jgi:hypothetical protein
LAEEKNNLTSARDFLLGKLSPEMRTRLEENFLTDDEVFEEIEIAEDELIDAYVRNDLLAHDRHYFEQTLLQVPRIADRVKVARVLSGPSVTVPTVADRMLSDSAARTAGWRSWFWPTSVVGKVAFASVGLVVIFGSAEYLRLREATRRLQDDRVVLERRIQDLSNMGSQNSTERDRLKAELELQRAENARLNEQIERQLDHPVPSVPILSLTLFAGASRAIGATESLRLQATPAVFQFNLLLETDDYPSYKVVITTLSGREIGQRSNLKAHPSGKTVRFNFSSTRFTAGDYLVNLSGTTASGQSEAIATYSFRVLSTSSS